MLFVSAMLEPGLELAWHLQVRRVLETIEEKSSWVSGISRIVYKLMNLLMDEGDRNSAQGLRNCRWELYSPVSGNRTVVTGKGDLEVSHQEKEYSEQAREWGREEVRKGKEQEEKIVMATMEWGWGENPRGSSEDELKLVDEISWFWKSKMGLFWIVFNKEFSWH